VTRTVQIVLLAAMLGLLLRLLVRGEYVYYVKPGLLPALIGSAIVLTLMIVFVAKDAWAAADHDHDHAHDDHAPDDHAHGEPRAALLLALPLIVVLTVAPAPLGAFSATRSTAGTTATNRTFAPLPPGDPVELAVPDFVDRARASGDTLAGREVRLVGFVTPNPNGPWWLTRFVVNCCAADATSYRVVARGGPQLEADTWVSLTGHWVRSAGTPDGIPTLQVVDYEPAQPPSNPYAG
jgi:uncharacterized repeat protein (TIGR03943 family)